MASDTWASAGSGALGGAGIGANIGGAIAPGWGHAIGGLLGALGGGATGFFGGRKGGLNTPATTTQLDRFGPEQLQLLNLLQGSLTGQGAPQGGILGDLLGPQAGQLQADRAKEDFEKNIIPNLAERFSGVGGQSSSAFRNALGEAGSDLSARIQEMNQQRQMSLLGPLLQMLMQPRFNTYFTPSGPSGAASLLGQLGQIGGQALGNLNYTRQPKIQAKATPDASTIDALGNITGSIYR